jgi:acetyl-CoA acetyltransferase
MGKGRMIGFEGNASRFLLFNGGIMVDVAVIGVGQTRFGNLYDMGRKELFSEAFWEALGDIPKGLDPTEIEEAYIGTMETGGAH